MTSVWLKLPAYLNYVCAVSHQRYETIQVKVPTLGKVKRPAADIRL